MLGFLKKVTTSVLGESRGGVSAAEVPTHAPIRRQVEHDSDSVMHRGRFLRDMPVSQLRRLLAEDFGERVPSDSRRHELVSLLAAAVLRSQHGPLAASSPVATHRPPAQLPLEAPARAGHLVSTNSSLKRSAFSPGKDEDSSPRPTKRLVSESTVHSVSFGASPLVGAAAEWETAASHTGGPGTAAGFLPPAPLPAAPASMAARRRQPTMYRRTPYNRTRPALRTPSLTRNADTQASQASSAIAKRILETLGDASRSSDDPEPAAKRRGRDEGDPMRQPNLSTSTPVHRTGGGSFTPLSTGSAASVGFLSPFQSQAPAQAPASARRGLDDESESGPVSLPWDNVSRSSSPFPSPNGGGGLEFEFTAPTELVGNASGEERAGEGKFVFSPPCKGKQAPGFLSPPKTAEKKKKSATPASGEGVGSNLSPVAAASPGTKAPKSTGKENDAGGEDEGGGGGQAVGGWGDMFKKFEEGKWTCGTCSSKNSDKLDKCAACETDRKHTPADSSATKPASSAALPAASGLTFGAPSKAALPTPSAPSFGTGAGATQAKQTGSSPAALPTPSVSFGAPSGLDSASKTAPKPGFVFGAPTVTSGDEKALPAALPAEGFSFGAKSADSKPLSKGEEEQPTSKRRSRDEDDTSVDGQQPKVTPSFGTSFSGSGFPKAPDTALPSLTFGTSNGGASSATSATTFGLKKGETSIPSFSFGATGSTTAAAKKPEEATAAPAATSFSFGATESTQKKTDSSTSDASAAAAAAAAAAAGKTAGPTATPAFTFGAKAPAPAASDPAAPPQKATPAFTFGSAPTPSAAPAAPAFVFGGAPAAAAPAAAPSAAPATETTAAFTFGSSESVSSAPPAPTAAFTFGAATPAPVVTAPTPSTAPAFSFGGKPPVSGGGTKPFAFGSSVAATTPTPSALSGDALMRKGSPMTMNSPSSDMGSSSSPAAAPMPTAAFTFGSAPPPSAAPQAAPAFGNGNGNGGGSGGGSGFAGFGASTTPAIQAPAAAASAPAPFAGFGAAPFGGGSSAAPAPSPFGGSAAPAPSPFGATAPTAFGGFGGGAAPAPSQAPFAFGGGGAASMPSVATVPPPAGASSGGGGGFSMGAQAGKTTNKQGRKIVKAKRK